MKSLFVLVVCLLMGNLVFATNVKVKVLPDKGFYRPGDSVQIRVSASSGNQVEAQVLYLTQEVATLSAAVVDGQAVLSWTPPPDAPRGYGLVVEIKDSAGTVIAREMSAFDVLNHWMDAPRYGFFSDFSGARRSDETTVEWLLQHHINGIQFYDWQYRWEDLIPETETFADGLGRPQSMATILRLVDVIRARNIAAMPYTAIYGASVAFYRQNPDWALFSATGEAYMFGENLIAIMNPAPGSAWNQHLLGEFADVLDHTAFDGIHIDQYGAPKTGYDKDGNFVDLAVVMPQFIDQTAALVDEKRGDEGVVLFNSVGNWPIEKVAPARQDASYIEVWPPHDDYLDLNRIVTNAQRHGNGKPVIIAAYISPERTINWQLANAVILASGGTHLETGEPETMLADPYFPRFEHLSNEQLPLFRRFYDFQVRYENVLRINTHEGNADAVDLGDIRTRGIRSKDRVVPIVRSGSDFDTFSLINFVGIDRSDWNMPTSVPPTPITNLEVKIEVTRPVAKVWFASPDEDATMNGTALATIVKNGALQFTLPTLNTWTMIVVEYADAH